MAERTLNTIIAPKCTVKGNLILENSVEIYGTFEGNITTKEDIIIRKGGEVRTDIKARHVIIEGMLTGNIDAAISVMIGAQGKVIGDIKSPHLKLEEGATTIGKISINQEKPTPPSEPTSPA
ncbi:hypothetical protein COTS27_01246 [Spirochaetota bacterium]|nr:hypothetical protein COTS27_01246 [Spirochaetota bacterium]